MHEKNTSRQHVLNLTQKLLRKTISQIWLWLVYKITENNCRSRPFAEFIQTQKSYSNSLNKISNLNLRLFAISSQNNKIFL